MIKCEKCNAKFSNSKVYDIHQILCPIKKEDKEKTKEQIEEIVQEKKAKKTTKKKKSGEDI